jgi:hypothetical protein
MDRRVQKDIKYRTNRSQMDRRAQKDIKYRSQMDRKKSPKRYQIQKPDG